MPEWVWTVLIVVILVDKFSKVTVIDLLRGLVHLEFVEKDEPVSVPKPLKHTRQIRK